MISTLTNTFKKCLFTYTIHHCIQGTFGNTVPVWAGWISLQTHALKLVWGSHFRGGSPPQQSGQLPTPNLLLFSFTLGTSAF